MIAFETYADKKGEFRWRARAANGEVMADSAEGYTREHDCEHAKKRFVELIFETFSPAPPSTE